MELSNLFWPSDRKLFRQRLPLHSRPRIVVPIIAVVAMALLAVAFGHSGWT